jgi:hypothetical protein
MGGGNAQKSAMARERNAAQKEGVGGGGTAGQKERNGDTQAKIAAGQGEKAERERKKVELAEKKKLAEEVAAKKHAKIIRDAEKAAGGGAGEAKKEKKPVDAKALAALAAAGATAKPKVKKVVAETETGAPSSAADEPATEAAEASSAADDDAPMSEAVAEEAAMPSQVEETAEEREARVERVRLGRALGAKNEAEYAEVEAKVTQKELVGSARVFLKANKSPLVGAHFDLLLAAADMA